MAVSLSSLIFEHHPPSFPLLGIGEAAPRLSWRFAAPSANDTQVTGWQQTAYDIEITRSDGTPKLFSVQNASESVLVPWPDEPLGSAESAQVRARAYGHGEGQTSSSATPWTDAVVVETGLLNGLEDWQGAFTIAADRATEVDAPKRPVMFRKGFEVAQEEVESARLYITALGLYVAELNGERVGDHVLAPGYQSYNHRHVYDTYDVTQLVKTAGENILGVTVGEGWYSGRFGLRRRRNLYGDTLGLLCMMVIKTKDGGEMVVKSDADWRAGLGPMITSEIYNGELYNSSLEMDGWSTSEFDDSDWLGVKEIDGPTGELAPLDGPPIRKIREVKPKEIFQSDSGKTVVDFGQNLVGWLRLSVSGPDGTNITMVHTEVMEDGEVATRPLRSADQSDTLLLSEKDTQVWEPTFTYHGFRYVQVTGWPNTTTLDGDSMTALVVHSDMERTGYFESSHDTLNQFHENVLWSMRGNFLGVPTDCPQRDERLGWTGDAHAFMPTANYLYESSGFWRSWLKDAWSEQKVAGYMVPPVYVPTDDPSNSNPERVRMPTAVWSDVVVGNPWALYRSSGDLRMLEEQYEAAQAWIDIGLPRNEEGLWDRSTFQYADWLDPKSPPTAPGNATTAKHLVADAYLIEMTRLISNMSAILGKTSEAEQYATQRTDLISAFHEAWISPYDTIIANVTQTALALGIQFDIFNTPELREEATNTLRQVIADNDYLVGTGFAGTQQLGPALTSVGATSDFYKMLLQTEVPSWLYQVVMGGTTTWERWDSLLPNGTVNSGSMTSFNHYAFGSVADWVHQKIGGLAPGEPGWKTAVVAPEPGGGITHAKAEYLSPYGWVNSTWNVGDAGFELEVSVPPNAMAEVTLPGGNSSTVMMGSGTRRFTVEGYTMPE